MRRPHSLWSGLLAVGTAAAVQAAPCAPPQRVVEAKSAEVQAWFEAQRPREALVFVGYSAAGYEKPKAMRTIVERTLRRADPAKTIVVAGATAEGIGAVYEIAKRMGFTTAGIVSTQARAQGAAMSPCVDVLFYVSDDTWGGYLPGTQTLSPTSQAMVAAGTRFVAIGGAEVARDELLEARNRGKHVRFHAADFDHALARERAKQRGEGAPRDFKGAVYPVFAGPH